MIRFNFPYLTLKIALIFVGILISIYTVIGFYWSIPPKQFSITKNALHIANINDASQIVTGYTTTATIYELGNILLTKRGGFLLNDKLSPGVFLDNISNWEFGVLIQIRDMLRSLRKDFSRSQSQSKEDPDLIVAEPRFNFDARSWILPSSESEYRSALDALKQYMNRLQNKNQTAHFFARADNLTKWLTDVETRLGSLSQRLSASVGKKRLNTNLAGDPNAQQSDTNPDADIEIKTPWFNLDDIFYEARGTTYALIHLLKAVSIDFNDILEKKNAVVSVRQIIRELEETQVTLWSPMILNGSGFGIFANHSLVMANYISRANAALIDLHRLLTQG